MKSRSKSKAVKIFMECQDTEHQAIPTKRDRSSLSSCPQRPGRTRMWKAMPMNRKCAAVQSRELSVRTCVQPGQTVKLDDLLVVLEAMKMETSLTAPIAGTVKSVKVAAGEAVKLHQILVEFE